MRQTALLAVLAALLSAVPARADDDRVRILRDPTPYTNVIDAADDQDPFDLNLHVGYGWSRYRADIQRDAPSATGAQRYDTIGRYEHVRQTLDLELEVGLYKDLEVFAYLPIVLSDTQSVTAGADAAAASDVFATPFRSPDRSGLDVITTGLAWQPLNQNRMPEVPNWVLIVDTTTPIGARMRPCDASAPCPNAPGIARGTQGVHFETRLSRRYRFVEPYFGLGARGEIPTSAESAFRPVGNLPGYQRKFPPIVGEFTLGAAFIPFEHLRRFQRLVIDLRMVSQYVSSGRDYSPLFDALGSSANPGLTSLNCENGTSVPAGSTCATGASVPFTGITDTEAYGRIGGRIGLDFQAAQYVRFTFASNLVYWTAHYLSAASACNAGVDQATHPDQVGTCTSGIVNPDYRSVLDEPGHKFHVNGGLQLDFFASAIAQF